MDQDIVNTKLKVVRRKKAISETEEVKVPAMFDDKPKFNTEAYKANKIAGASLSERVAGDSLCYKNHYYNGGKTYFSGSPDMQYVHKYYPYAIGGPLYVDEIGPRDNESMYQIKARYFKEKGMRYLLIKPKMTYLECIEAVS